MRLHIEGVSYILRPPVCRMAVFRASHGRGVPSFSPGCMLSCETCAVSCNLRWIGLLSWEPSRAACFLFLFHGAKRFNFFRMYELQHQRYAHITQAMAWYECTSAARKCTSTTSVNSIKALYTQEGIATNTCDRLDGSVWIKEGCLVAKRARDVFSLLLPRQLLSPAQTSNFHLICSFVYA